MKNITETKIEVNQNFEGLLDTLREMAHENNPQIRGLLWTKALNQLSAYLSDRHQEDMKELDELKVKLVF